MNHTEDILILNDNGSIRPEHQRAPGLDLSSLTGKWKNTNPAAGGIAEINVSQVDGGLTVQVFGARSTGMFDWGILSVTPYAYDITGQIVAGFEVTYEFEDQKALVTAIHNRGVLVIHAYHKFNEDRLRTNYICKEFFHQ